MKRYLVLGASNVDKDIYIEGCYESIDEAKSAMASSVKDTANMLLEGMLEDEGCDVCDIDPIDYGIEVYEDSVYNGADL